MKIIVAALLMATLMSGCTGAETPVADSGAAWDLTDNVWRCRKLAGQPDGGEFADRSDCHGLEMHDRTWPND